MTLRSLEGALASNSANLETCSDLCGKSALSTTQDNIKEFLARRHRLDLLPRGLHLELLTQMTTRRNVVEELVFRVPQKMFAESFVVELLPADVAYRCGWCGPSSTKCGALKTILFADLFGLNCFLNCKPS
jgi:hypothetical protein